jgi:hypothetical protein
MRRQASVKKNLPQDPHTPLVDVVSSLTPGVEYGQLRIKRFGPGVGVILTANLAA